MLNDFYHDFVGVELVRSDDGVGGEITTLIENGVSFRGGVRMMNTREMKVAEANNIIASYKINIPKSVKVAHKDVVKDSDTNILYRVTSHPQDIVTPTISTFDFYIVYADRLELN